jgi:hypothetical protein
VLHGCWFPEPVRAGVYLASGAYENVLRGCQQGWTNEMSLWRSRRIILKNGDNLFVFLWVFRKGVRNCISFLIFIVFNNWKSAVFLRREGEDYFCCFFLLFPEPESTSVWDHFCCRSLQRLGGPGVLSNIRV